jgi:alanyl-tRNA synthetase
VSEAAAPTERLYYTDAFSDAFTARIVDRADDGRRIYLDRTAFYPTSGGQQHDLGTLGNTQVVDVIDEDERIAHLLAEPIGDSVTDIEGKIDWNRRFDHMQQHTGQHLLSAVFEDLVGARTVSVHFGDTHSTLDLEIDGLSREALNRVERRANEVVAENRAVTVTFEDSASATGLRKAVDRAGPLRIVSIESLDRSACGGTHVRATGEIGAILLRGTERIRKTMRVEFLCGLRAVERARADYLGLSAIAASLSSSLDAAPGLVAAQAAELKDAEQARRKLERAALAWRAKELYDAAPAGASGVRFVRLDVAADDMESMRTMAQSFTGMARAAFAARVKGGTAFVIATSEDSGIDAGKLVREALAAVGGKGGGSPRIAQGNAPTPDAAETLIAALANAIG